MSSSVQNRSELKAIRAIFCVFVSKTFNCIFQASKRSKEAKVIFLQKIFKNPFFNLMFFISISTPTPFRQMALTLFDPLPPPSETFFPFFNFSPKTTISFIFWCLKDLLRHDVIQGTEGDDDLRNIKLSWELGHLT